MYVRLTQIVEQKTLQPGDKCGEIKGEQKLSHNNYLIIEIG